MIAAHQRDRDADEAGATGKINEDPVLRAEEFIELDPEDAIEVDLETGASCADAKASTSTELAGSNFS